MGAGHVLKLICAVLNPTFLCRGDSVLTQHQGGENDLCAAKAVVACMFSQRFLSAERNLFVLRSKVYRQSIHGSISCTHQLLYWRS